MIEKPIPLMRLRKIPKWGLLVPLAIILGSVLWMVSIWFFDGDHEDLMAIEEETYSEEPFDHQMAFSLDGPFTLRGESEAYVPRPKLSKELVYLGENCRPDAAYEEKRFLLGLLGEKRQVIENEKVCLKLTEKGFCFSIDPTSIWFTIKTHDPDQISVLLTLRARGIEGESLFYDEEIFDLKVAKQQDQTFFHEGYNEAYEQLQTFKCLGPDRFLELYGGEEFSEKKVSSRIQNVNRIIFLKENDLLIFQENHWKLVTENDSTVGYPIARVSAATAEEVELLLWDEEGFSPVSLSFVKEFSQGDMLDFSDLFSQISPMGASAVSLRVEDKTILMHEGDWLLNGNGGWHIIQDVKELESLLRDELTGDFFVFDGIEQTEEGLFYKGYGFDKSRSTSQRVCLPISIKAGRRELPRMKIMDMDEMQEYDFEA